MNNRKLRNMEKRMVENKEIYVSSSVEQQLELSNILKDVDKGVKFPTQRCCILLSDYINERKCDDDTLFDAYEHMDFLKDLLDIPEYETECVNRLILEYNVHEYFYRISIDDLIVYIKKLKSKEVKPYYIF